MQPDICDILPKKFLNVFLDLRQSTTFLLRVFHKSDLHLRLTTIDGDHARRTHNSANTIHHALAQRTHCDRHSVYAEFAISMCHFKTHDTSFIQFICPLQFLLHEYFYLTYQTLFIGETFFGTRSLAAI